MTSKPGPDPLLRVQRPCGVCGSHLHTILHDNRMAQIDDIDLSYQVASCEQCGFAFATTMAPAGDYARYYREFSKYDFAPSVDALARVDVFRAEKAVEICADHLRRQAPIVDLGCGCGTLLAAFRSAGFKHLAGFDPSPNASEAARRLFGLDNVRQATLTEALVGLDLPDGALVCATGVLEHLFDLRGDARLLASALPPGGMLLLEVPSVERFECAPMEPYGEFSLEHVQFFSQGDLLRLFAGLGLVCVTAQQVALAGATDSLFALFRKDSGVPPSHAPSGQFANDTRATLQRYLQASASAWSSALQRLRKLPARPTIIYGAGSHTARMLPEFATHGVRCEPISIVDGNPNLQGHALGGIPIRPPSSLDENEDVLVIISSFRAERAIADALARKYRNPVVQLYA